MTEYTLSEAYKRDLDALLIAWKGGELGGSPATPATRNARPRPPLIVMLLDDIESGTRGPAAVLAKEETNEIQIVTIVGAITGGDFTLDYDPGDGGDLQTTAGIPYNATPRQLQEALEELDSINPGDVAVSFGKIVRDVEETENTYTLYRWVIEFTGQFAAENVELLTPNGSGITGAPNLTVAAGHILEDTGRVELVNAAVPVPTPTPLKRGAIGAVEWYHGIGYGIVALEPRPVTQYADYEVY